VGTTTSTGNVDLVKSLGADEVIDYKKQEFEEVLRDYDAVLGTVRGDAIKKSLRILKPKTNVVSLIGPPDAAFARARGMNFFMKCVFGLLSRKIIRDAKKRGIEYSFPVRIQTVGNSQRSANLKAARIRPVIDKTFPFDQAKEALAYLEKGRAKGKIVVQMK
jgi:NADPH:quinone reductase-like Zn-dependent oxidoreductase